MDLVSSLCLTRSKSPMGRLCCFVEAAQGFYVLNELLHPEGCRIFNLLFLLHYIILLIRTTYSDCRGRKSSFYSSSRATRGSMRKEDGGSYTCWVGCVIHRFVFLLCLLLIDLSSLCKVTQRFVIHGTGL